MRIEIHPHYQSLAGAISRLPECFDGEGTVLHEGRNTVKAFTLGGTPMVVKRYKKPHILQRIDYTLFRPSKAKRAYHFAARLRELGFDTPHEVACIEERRCGLFSRGYFVSLPCNDPSTRDLLIDNPSPSPQLIDALAALLAALHEKGVLHGDLNLSNILYRTAADGSYRFTLIDTNRSRFLASPSRKECARNLMRLTHQRPLLERIVTRYAQLRSWDAEAFTAAVIAQLDTFERKNRMKRKLFKH